MRCADRQLKDFTGARTRTKSRARLHREGLVQHLLGLDRQPGMFNFLELPAELRNNIYEQLLLLRRGKSGCRCCLPEILRTSKQVREWHRHRPHESQ